MSNEIRLILANAVASGVVAFAIVGLAQVYEWSKQEDKTDEDE